MKIHNRLNGFLVLLLAVLLFQACSGKKADKTQRSSTAFVTARGSQLLTPEGVPFKIRGTNLGNWLLPEGYMFKFKNADYARQIYGVSKDLLGPDEARLFWKEFRENYITRADIKLLKTLGFNTIRLPFDYKLFTPEEYPDAWIGPGFHYIDQIVEWANEFEMFVILDMHAAPGGQNGENIDDGHGYPFLMISKASQARTASMWKKIADHYKNEPAVMGYDVLNEPIPHFDGYDSLNVRLEPIYRQIVDSIRTVDPNHIVFLGGAQWDTNFSVFDKPFDNKLGYTFHKYWMPPVQEEIQAYVDFRDKYNVPVYMGESGENSDQWVKNFRSLLDDNNIGWTFWPYKKMMSEAGVISFSMPEGWDKIQKYEEAYGKNYEVRRKVRPPFAESRAIFNRLLENIKLENCRLNEGYIDALGMEPVLISDIVASK